MEMPFRENAALPARQVSSWSQRGNAAVKEMLDHLAEELAKEYVRPMKSSAEREVGK